jgi:Arc-like DNA binding domain
VPAVSARDQYRFLLRMPQELRDSLRDAAERSGRSLNAEIVARLQASVGGPAPRRARRRARLVAAIAGSVLALATSGAVAEQRLTASGDDPAAKPVAGLKWALVGEAQYATPQYATPVAP